MITKYKLLKDLPELKAGAIFEHREYDEEYPDRGNHGTGCLILSWIDGNCQQGWCGETYIFQGQCATNREWFEPITKDKEECKCYGVSLEGICTRCDKTKSEDKQEEIEFEDIKDIEESIVHLWFGKKINKLIMNQKKIINIITKKEK